ncbi:MAG: hypothetical protein A3D49_01480 [Candidatus Zambryskibacteria bacterium RIFCSPHIGHO2_02_FULL_43_37]|uniref:Uncharacterized protein n=1 Tax=Candidatus Zambryskibacteria bacterium RIFCSPHIGHO2_02_FULL_43_37 TaxID=1802749 RepID=A0A1G2TGU8_9BACT|nr:MAG: hypothetical protein A2723_01420 [Candidatus Zambryskibacteria bacterium RIFCSPHIGHO2_01_FULL_52_18]OHA96526.1 MAG: hypothetical protein A3D49_01480 [Candidatus Zambryskibacteria bacterium RIFCSPHIGHO2_02_FULL_43_37]OHB07194.1 MAG: hypothetical protein A2944_01250 [Candidatus Zambryskibacteria bacterium RIFCSPLOWO2_01_FULL_52_12]
MLSLMANNAYNEKDEVKTVLIVLQQSRFKAADAHKIAEDHAGLPGMLRSIRMSGLAEFAEEVLADLRGRKDEKKPGVSAATASNVDG